MLALPTQTPRGMAGASWFDSSTRKIDNLDEKMKDIGNQFDGIRKASITRVSMPDAEKRQRAKSRAEKINFENFKRDL